MRGPGKRGSRGSWGEWMLQQQQSQRQMEMQRHSRLCQAQSHCLPPLELCVDCCVLLALALVAHGLLISMDIQG